MKSERRKLPRRHRPITRVVAGGILGVALAFLLRSDHVDLAPSLLAGWTVLSSVFVVWTWLALWWLNPLDTKTHAEQEQPGHVAVVSLVLTGAVASLWAIGVLIEQAREKASGVPHGIGAAAIAVGSVALSWMTIHTLYTLIYAKHYFGREDPHGIDFNSSQPPSYRDFFYVAFAIGMSFAIPDTNLKSTRMRTIALGQGLLSFVFGTLVIASVVNLLSSL
ncbi:MAG: DUF1345 domain-containing protein [Mycobacterium sp.]|nr:DUF1345 domain-containing protein [Mycobacterium sp.]